MKQGRGLLFFSVAIFSCGGAPHQSYDTPSYEGPAVDTVAAQQYEMAPLTSARAAPSSEEPAPGRASPSVAVSSAHEAPADATAPQRGAAPPAPSPAPGPAPTSTPTAVVDVEPLVVQQPAIAARRLTAATVGDSDRRGPYLQYLARHPSERAIIGLDMSRRVRFRVLDGQNRPVHDALVETTVGGRTIQGRTHADGYFELFPSLYGPQTSGNAAVTVRAQGHESTLSVNIPPSGDADVAVQLEGAAGVAPSTLDLAFAIDITGSMGDELRYVNQEVVGIVARVRAAVPQTTVRVGATFYRDRGDAVPLQMIPFSADVRGFMTQMSVIQASGGGDYPEDMNAGLAAAMGQLAWTQGQAVRVLVIIADAPPQRYPDSQHTYLNTIVDAAQRGIRILPVAASGADRVVEYLFRAMGAATSTPYVYLTDDSGIGAPHMEADTDRIAVEMFSDLLTRLMISDLRGQGMHEPSFAEQGLAPLAILPQ